MIAFWVALVLLLSTVGSLLWAVPSRLEKRQARMREAAKQAGLSLTTLNISDQSERGRIDASRRLVTGYRLRCPAPQIKDWPPCLLLRTTSGGHYGLPDHWCWADQAVLLTPKQSLFLQNYLHTLPSWVEAWGITSQGIVAVIEERQGESRIIELELILVDWRTRIASQHEHTNNKR